MTNKKWRQVSVPDELLRRIEIFVDKSPKYQSPTEFARHALSEKLKREDVSLEESTKLAVEG